MSEYHDQETGEVQETDEIVEMTSLGQGIPKEIVQAIIRVMAGASQLGFDERNEHGKFNYVSVDKFYAQLRPLMAKAGLITLIDERNIGYRDGQPSREGRVTPWLTLEYDIFLAHTTGAIWGPLRRHIAIPMTGAQTFGAAKSFAEKYFLRNLFKVPTGEKDADDDGYTRAAEEAPIKATRHRPTVAVATPDRAVAIEIFKRIRDDIQAATSIEQLNKTGINSSEGEEDERKIRAISTNGWRDLEKMDEAKRKELMELLRQPSRDFELAETDTIPDF